MKKPEIKKLDKLWSEKIRSKGKCEVCGKNISLNSHHIVGRRNHTLRWDAKNGVCLCSGCHVFSTRSAHQDPIGFNDWLEENCKEDLEYLREQRDIVKKQTDEDVL